MSHSVAIEVATLLHGVRREAEATCQHARCTGILAAHEVLPDRGVFGACGRARNLRHGAVYAKHTQSKSERSAARRAPEGPS